MTTKVFVISDSSGETAAHVVRSASAQFPLDTFTIRRLPRVHTTEEIKAWVAEIAGPQVLIAYTLVLPDFRETLVAEVTKYGLPAVDLMGPLISALSQVADLPPLASPGRAHLLDEAYFKRMEAVNFSVHYDDGKDPEGLVLADVVLVGLSRTSKTPNSMYLAQHYGLKAANVPLVRGITPPKTLYQIPKGKIIGLSIHPDYLISLRLARAQSMGLSASVSYAELEEIELEVKYAHRIHRELGCYVIDVTTRAIEETSSEIVLYLERQER